MDFWMNLFKDMRDSGLLHTNNEGHLHSLRFAFMDLIRNDLDRVAVEWNQHNIDVKRSAQGPKGKPDVLYYLPEKNGELTIMVFP